MKKELLLGYFDLNFGDDWLIKNYVNEYKVNNVELLLSDERLFKPFNDDDRFSFSKNKFDKIKALFTANSFVIVGGSMFQYNKYWFRHFLKVLFFMMVFSLRGKKCSVIGCNIKKESSLIFTYVISLLFKLVNEFRVRDKLSYDSLIKIYGVNKDKISVKKDLADGCFSSLPKKNNRCSISIINSLLIDDDKYFKALDSEINRMKILGVSNFDFFSFDSGSESDENAIQRYLNYVRDNDIDLNFNIVLYNSNISDFITKWSSNKYAITTRFHSYILAKNSKQEIRVLSYSKKINTYISTFYEEDVNIINDL
ncbi:TPA: polysaccharide pyruvyl transferase family protein [Photobacterium damselae]